jgi:hypothetical protein
MTLTFYASVPTAAFPSGPSSQASALALTGCLALREAAFLPDIKTVAVLPFDN